jgi:hypothetical protein
VTAYALVDADHKNCLAQLTVAQKLNQGNRQCLYIIAGVLFWFFFVQAKKNRGTPTIKFHSDIGNFWSLQRE